MQRFCLVAGVLLALVAAAAAQGCSNCTAISLGFRHTVFCELGAKSYASSGPFKPADFKFTCVGDVSKPCDAIENALIAGDVEYSCCSCYLYAEHCHKAMSTYVTNKNLDNNPHVLLMPSAPCTGIENWNKGKCPQEEIWDEGAATLASAKKGDGWGMAINPVSRRGQHQMHMHLAEVFPSLMAAIEKVHKAGNTSAFVDCVGKHTCKCNVVDKGHDTSSIKVTLFKGSSPAKAGPGPFMHAYGSIPSPSNPLVLYASTLVVRVPKTTDMWAVVTNPTGPAECFFLSTTENCKST